jgi:hypothetical protein
VKLYTEVPQDADVVVFGFDCAIEGGIVFDPHDSDALVPTIAAALVTETVHTIVVVGTGGGVGVTTVALHLALNAARDHSTCYLGGTDAAIRLDLPVEAWSNEHPIPVAGGFRVSLTGDHRVLEAAQETSEVVIVDAIDPDADLLGWARAVVLVMPPTVPGARRASDLMREHPDARWAPVTNRLGPGGEMTRVALERILDRSIAVELPTCAPLRDAEDDGQLLQTTLYRWPRRVEQLWRTLERA